MNRKFLRVLRDGVISLALVLFIIYLQLESKTLGMGYGLALSLVPLIWLGLRHSGATAIVFASIAGLIQIALFDRNQWVDSLLVNLTPLLTVGFSGLFARYTQKTLNNRRYSSTYLNIGTAATVVSLAYFLVKYVLIPLAVPSWQGLDLMGGALWVSILLTALVTTILLIALARLWPAAIIPKRSRYLSRKETSRLLND